MSDDKPQFATMPFTSSPPVVESPSGNTFAPYASPTQVDSPFGNTFGHSATHGAASSNAWKGKPRRWIPDLKDPVLHNNRTLVLCFDGTGDQFDSDNSNIVQFMALLKKDSPDKQKVYYQSGVGTYRGMSAATPGTLSKVVDFMIASTLGAHVRDGYEFLMENYSAGDKICLFGFSRGAYTARALAGMLQKVGLLPPGNRQQIPFAYHMYKRNDEKTSIAEARDFKRTYSTDVAVEFVGVWDSVASVGAVPKSLPFVSTNNCIRFFRHAIALDEHRAKFMPNFYKQWASEEAEVEEEQCDEDTGEHPAADEKKPRLWLLRDPPKKSNPKSHRIQREHSQAWLLEYDLNAQVGQETDALEVMFAGSHADVGGGSVENHVRYSLARIPLRFMIRECFKAKTGIIFDMDMLHTEVGMDIDLENHRILEPPAPMSPAEARQCIRSISKANARRLASGTSWKTMFRSKTKIPVSHAPTPSTLSSMPASHGEAFEEMMDALSPIYDQLSIAPFWWILEWTPLRQLRQQAIYDATNSEADFFWMVNRGKGRKIFKHVVRRGIKVHRSVLTRLKASDQDGKPATYVPLVRPNLHGLGQHGQATHTKYFRSMTHDEWLNGHVDGLGRWLEWFN